MSAPVLSIIILAAMFLLATVLPLNMGALAFVGAFLLGSVVLGMSTNDILANFPGGLFLTIVGVTYLFAIAQNNGTIDLLVRGAVRLVGSNVALIPWVMFAITAVITAVGALSPAAVAIIAPIALSFAAKHKINPLHDGHDGGPRRAGRRLLPHRRLRRHRQRHHRQDGAGSQPHGDLPGQLRLQPRHRRGAVHRPRRQQTAAPRTGGRLVEQAAEKRMSVSVGARAAGVTLQGSGSDISAAGVSSKGTSGGSGALPQPVPPRPRAGSQRLPRVHAAARHHRWA